MMKKITVKHYEKYPKYFLTTHGITVRNYNRLNIQYDEDKFKEKINIQYEWKYKNYIFIYPKSVQDVKDEAIMQQNCLASYINPFYIN